MAGQPITCDNFPGPSGHGDDDARGRLLSRSCAESGWWRFSCQRWKWRGLWIVSQCSRESSWAHLS